MWDLVLSDEQAMIENSVRDYLDRELPLERLRPKAAPHDLARARAGMAELGLLGIGLSEAAGGSGLGLVEEALIQRQCGRNLVSPSLLATVLAAHVAFLARDATLARAFVSGREWACLAMAAANSGDGDQCPVYAFDRNPGDWLLLWNEDGMGLFDGEGFARSQSHACLDDSVTLQQARIALDRPRHWIESNQAPLALRAQVLIAARMSGLAQQSCELTVEYAKTRRQFGKPIGSFQAVKHRCADMALRANLAWQQTAHASLKVQAGAHDAVLQAASAKLIAAQAAHENGRAAIQLHGAIGFQSECDVHWFMKRAHLYDQVGGSMQTLARKIAGEPSPLW